MKLRLQVCTSFLDFCWTLTRGAIAISQSAVCSALADEEEESIRCGERLVFHDDVSPSVLINQGLELEEQQYVFDFFIIYVLLIHEGEPSKLISPGSVLILPPNNAPK
jgi:hypothetical protein